MTKLFFRVSIFSMLLATLFMTSCEEGVNLPDPGPGVNVPSVSSSVSADTELTAGSDFTTTITASEGDSPLNAIEVLENGVRVPTAGADNRLVINGTAAASNPILLFDADKTSLTYEVTVLNVPAGVNNYEFVVTDEAGEAGSASVNVTGLSDPLAITLGGSNTFDNVTADSRIGVPVIATAGTSTLSTISVAENGVLMDAASVGLETVTFDANPYTLAEEDVNGFEKNVVILVSEGTNVYTITLTDAAGEKVSTDVTVNATSPTTAISGEFTAVVLNNNSGPNKGGLDLYNGIAVSTASEFDQAQVVDEGINNDLPLADNWLQEITPVNNARLRLPGNSQPEGFSYENIDSQEAIIAAFESAGDDVSNSGKLSEGDILLVNSGNDYFILQIATISVTTGDNMDFYEINIKQAIQ